MCLFDFNFFFFLVVCQDLKKSLLNKKSAQQKKRRSNMSEERKSRLNQTAKEGMRKYRKSVKREKANEMKKLDRERRYLARACRKIGKTLGDCTNDADSYQKNFDCFMTSLQMKVCHRCKKKVTQSIHVKKRCRDCHIFSQPEMDPGKLPVELEGLTYVEQQLIAKIHPVVSVYRIRKGNQFAYRYLLITDT